MIDPWTRRKIIQDRKKGLSYKEIQSIHEVTKSQVQYIIEVERLGRKKVSSQELSKIKLLACKNMPTADIADELDLSVFQVRHSLKKLGLNRKKGCRLKPIK